MQFFIADTELLGSASLAHLVEWIIEFVVVIVEFGLMKWIFGRMYRHGVLDEPVSAGRVLVISVAANIASYVTVYMAYSSGFWSPLTVEIMQDRRLLAQPHDVQSSFKEEKMSEQNDTDRLILDVALDEFDQINPIIDQPRWEFASRVVKTTGTW